MDMIHGCDEISRQRDTGVIGMRDDEHMTMNAICDENSLLIR